MRKLAFIPTREDKDRPIKAYLEEAGWKVFYLVGKESIFDAYHNALKDHKVMAKDTVIMCHDDIEIMTQIPLFNEIVEKSLEPKDVGFVGIAGAKQLNKTCCWWHQLGREYPHPESFLQGAVWHGETIMSSRPTYYGGYGKVQVVDGLFLAAKGAILNSIKTAKPKEFQGNWDFYDIYYTMQATKKHKHNMVIPLMIRHASVGEGVMTDDWNANRNAFMKMFPEELAELSVPVQSEQQSQA